MTTDWFVKSECPRPDNEANNDGEIIKNCSGCPFVIWEKSEKVACFISSLFGVNVGSYSMAKDPDDIAKNSREFMGGGIEEARITFTFQSFEFRRVEE